MALEAYYEDNDSNLMSLESNKSSTSNFGAIIQKTISTHTIVDNDNVLIYYDPKTNQYLQVLNGNEPKNYYGNNECYQCKNSLGAVCHIDVESLSKLKDSTKKLICLLEEIQSKTHAKTNLAQADTQNLAELIKPFQKLSAPQTIADVTGEYAIKKLENQAKTFDATLIQDPEDDCSIYKRLTRQCTCLNQTEYNDFIIHFNEDSRFFTSTIGEIIKNLRILKKFLYMGGDYTKHALMFLNEGFSESTFTEKVDICQGCSHADMCNIFEENSIVVILISWPCKFAHYGDSTSQALAAAFLYKLAQLEEGRRYLKFNSKITTDIKKVLRTKVNKIEADTLKSLNTTLNLMHPAVTQSQHVNMSYYCKPICEGFGNNTLGALVQYRQYMTLDEVLTHLDLLKSLSEKDSGKKELISFLPAVIVLFKNMLMEYNNSEMNIIITNILNNVVSPSMVKSAQPRSTETKKKVMANTATDPILMRDDSVQIPPRKEKKGIVKSKKSRAPHKLRQQSFCKDLRNHFIIVPIDPV